MSKRSSSATISDKPEPSSQQEVVGTSNLSTTPTQGILDQSAAVIHPAPDVIDGAVILDNPIDSQASKIGETVLHQLCSIHGILFDDVLVPSGQDQPHPSPTGYTTCNKFMCWVGSVPPFNSFLHEVLRYIGIASA